MRRFILSVVTAVLWTTAAKSDDSLEVKFRSRALMDAAVSGYGKESPQGYYRLEDFRMGFKAVYGRYEMKADVGLGGGKVKVKDLLLNCHLGNSIVSLGNGYEPYSMDMLISTGDMRFSQSAASVLAFADSRKLGATYHYHTPGVYLAIGLYTHNDINNIGENQTNAFVSTSRAVWRRRGRDERLLHLGGAFSFRTREANTEKSPVRIVESYGVTSMFSTPMLKAEVENMGTELKGSIEALYMAPRWMIQAEYYLNRLNRTDGGGAYRPHGGYVQGSVLLKGRGFAYDYGYAVPGRPVSASAIELTARFNRTDMNDSQAGIYGGEEKDISLGVNVYLNRYLGVKLNGSYVWTGRHCDRFYDKDFFLVQMRVQYVL